MCEFRLILVICYKFIHLGYVRDENNLAYCLLTDWRMVRKYDINSNLIIKYNIAYKVIMN